MSSKRIFSRKTSILGLMICMLWGMNQLAFSQNGIDVQLPEEGDVLYRGKSTIINWLSSTADEVTVDLYRNGQLWDTNIASGTSTYLTWDVDPIRAVDSTYHVRVKEVGGSAWGESGIFTITNAYLEFDSGYDGRTVEVDQGFSFTWDHNMTEGSFELEYYAGSGWQPMATLDYTRTSYGWDPPNSLDGKTVKIQITNPSYSGLADQITDLTLVDYYISVSAPSGGQEFRDGDPLTINWTTHDFTSEDGVDIDLYKDGSFEKTLFSATSDDGSASWTVDEATASSAGSSSFQIRVYELVEPGVRGSESGSSGTFTLKKNQITFDAGLEGSEIRSGDPFEVSWTDNINQGQLELSYYHSSTGWTSLATVDTTATGYTWNTPESLSGPVKLAVASTWYAGVADTLHNLELIRYLDVSSPQTGNTWKIGNTEQIYWTSNATEQQVDIELLDTGDNPLGVIAAGVPTYAAGSDGSYLWDIEDTLPDGTPVAGNTDYKIRVATTNNNVLGVSGAFTIAWADYVSITAPTDHNGYNPGREMTITFASNAGSVDLDLVGPSNRSIATGYGGHPTSPPDGKTYHDYGWTVPSDLPEGDYYVRITGGAATATSGTFRVGVGQTLRIVSYDQYDDYGNVLQATDANGNTISHYYGSNVTPFSQDGENGAQGVYLTATTLVKPGGGDSLTTTASYNGQGLLETLTGQDSVTASFGYDGLGRLDEIYNEAGALIMAHDYNYDRDRLSPSDSNWVKTTTFAGTGTLDRVSIAYFDGLGRPVQSQQATGSSVVVTATEFDPRGRAWKTWKPYLKAGPAGYDSDFDLNATAAYGSNQYAFREQRYEASPLNRPSLTIPEGGQTVSGEITQNYGVEPVDGYNYQATTTTDESGKITKNYTDGWGRTVRTIADPDTVNAVTQFTYDEQDNLTKVTAPNGLITSYKYDTRGNLTEKTSPDAGTIRYTYDAAGNLRFTQDSVRAENGKVFFTTWDFAGRPLASGLVSPGGSFASLDPIDGEPFEDNSANWHHIKAYDSKPSGAQFPWDLFSAELSSFNPTNATGQLVAEAYKFTDTLTVAGSNHWQLTLYSYDAEGRLDKKRIHTGDRDDWETQLNYSYNSVGELTRQKITIGGETLYQHYSYNRRGLMDSMWVSTDGIVDSEPPEVTYTYTATGAVEQINYRGGTAADYGYTLRDWVQTINDVNSPNGNFAASYSYRKNGNVSNADFYNPDTGPGGAQNRYDYTFGYDGLSRLTGADYSGGSSTKAYDLAGLQYDPSGNITALQRYGQTDALIDSLDYNYTDNRLIHLQDAIADTGGIQVIPTEDPVFDEKLVEPWMNASWSATVDYASTEQAWEGSTSIRVDNDTWGALSVHYGPWGGPEIIEAGTYNKVSLMVYPSTSSLQMRLMLENDAGQSFPAVSLGTLPAGQWTAVEVDLAQLNPNGYDWERIDLLEDSGAPRTYYADSFRLIGSDTTQTGPLAWDAETADFGYDANGNLISQTGKFTDIRYDHRNLPTRFSMDDASKVLAAYNGEGQRILKELVGGSYRFYVKDGPQTLAVITDDTLRHINLFGNAQFGRIEAMDGVIDTSNARRYYISDHLGSTRAVTDQSGNILETFDYYPFGLLMPQRTSTAGNTIEKFTGKERDEAIGLDYFGARYLDPALGRWHSVDPMADEMPSWSPYNYTFNNPIAFVDPDGQAPLDWVQRADGSIEWDKNVTSADDADLGTDDTYLGRDLTFTFNSYISSSYDGPLGSFPVGNKLTSTISLTSNTDADNNLLSVDITSSYKVGATRGIFQGDNYFPGQSNTAINTSLTSSSVTFEQHAKVNGFEEAGLALMGYDKVNVAQRLNLGLSGNSLSVAAATDIFPSASLSVNGTQLFRYNQPSFKATHGIIRTQAIGLPQSDGLSRSPAVYGTKHLRPAPAFHRRYSNQ